MASNVQATPIQTPKFLNEMGLKPKEKKSVTLSYRTPLTTPDISAYNLFWQKQSGTDKDPINFNFKLPDGKSLISQSGGLQIMGDNVVLNSDLSVDRAVDINFK